MKQALLIVNALLVIAVSYLLYKQFSSPAGTPITAGSSMTQKQHEDSLSEKKTLIAYINMDSILNKYELAKRITADVEKRRDAVANESNKMEAALNSKFEGYQKRAATMTEEQAAAAREDMETTRTNLMQKKQTMDEDFRQWASNQNLTLMKDIQDYLKKFNADNTYSFIFSYEPGLFYYQDTTYDITSVVLKGLNEQYKATKAKK